MKLSTLKPASLVEYHAVFADLKSNQLLPPLTEVEYADLRDDIAEHGVIVPVQINHDGTVIDGHHRIAIAEDLGVYCPHEILNLTETEAQSMAIKLNIHRRQLNQAQKRELLATLIKAEPEKSDRQHAKIVGASDKTAGSVRRELESTAEIPQSATRVGADGRTTRPAKPADRTEGQPSTSPPPPRTPRRKPLTDEFDTAMTALFNAAKRIKKLTSDDRWEANQSTILVRNGPELTRVLTTVGEALGESKLDLLIAAGQAGAAAEYMLDTFGDATTSAFVAEAGRRIAEHKAVVGGDLNDEL